jgi:RHS repeat-associated protein
VATTYTYQDSRGWLTDIDTLAGSTVLQDINYAHDDAGRITATSSSVSGESWSYGYDDMDRLLSADNVNNNALDQNFTYDSVGNLTSNSLIGTYTYPAPGSARTHAVTATPLGSYGYDANGSMTSAAGDTLTYDGENRLVSVNSVQFVYGPDGARLKKINGASTTIYLGADIEIVGSTTIKYLPGDARRAGLSTTTWVSRDNLSSFRVESDGTGAVAWRANYRPYGERLITVAGVAESKGYIGERHDDETGLLYLNARYYDPVLARFVQADPSDPSQPGVGPNRYAYALGNPIAAIDPSGLSFGSWWPGGPVDFGTGIGYTSGAVPNGLSVNMSALSIGDYATSALNITKQMFEPYYDAYQNFVVAPLQYALTPIAESPLGDPGFYASIQGLGPPGWVLGGSGEAFAVSLRAFVGYSEALESGVWALGPAIRGLEIERALGGNLPSNFPVIDRFANGIATSIKSVDLNAAAYQDASRLTSLLNSYIDKVANFSGGRVGTVSIQPGDFTGRALDLGVPNGMSTMQQSVLDQAVAYGAERGVAVNVYVFP